MHVLLWCCILCTCVHVFISRARTTSQYKELHQDTFHLVLLTVCWLVQGCCYIFISSSSLLLLIPPHTHSIWTLGGILFVRPTIHCRARGMIYHQLKSGKIWTILSWRHTKSTGQKNIKLQENTLTFVLMMSHKTCAVSAIIKLLLCNGIK